MSPKSEHGSGQFCDVPARRSGNAVLPESAPLSRRMPQFIALEADTEAVLGRLKLAVIGLGSVGREAAIQMARWRPHTLWLVDPARFKRESLLTHGVVPDDVGQPKALSVGVLCRRLSPHTRVRFFDGRFQDLDPWELADADCVVLATDNLPVEIAVAQFCRRWGRRLLQASVYGDALVAQVRLLQHGDPDGPCLGCGYGEQEWEYYRRETTLSCAGPGDSPHGDSRQLPGQPTRSPAFLCAIAANLGVTVLARCVLGLGKPLGDSLLEYCGYTHATTHVPLRRRGACPCSHVAWAQNPVTRNVSDYRVSELARAAGFTLTSPEADTVSFLVGGHHFVDAAVCCGAPQVVKRFVPIGEPAGTCASCGRQRQVASLLARPTVPLSETLLDDHQPLSQRGAAAARWVALEGPHRAVAIRGPSFAVD